jgi:hypothetical protein
LIFGDSKAEALAAAMLALVASKLTESGAEFASGNIGRHGMSPAQAIFWQRRGPLFKL